jgi:DNA-binding CsgD family transcriptional regulator
LFERILTSIQALKGRLPTLREVIRLTSEGGRLKDMSAKLNGSEKIVKVHEQISVKKPEDKK